MKNIPCALLTGISILLKRFFAPIFISLILTNCSEPKPNVNHNQNAVELNKKACELIIKDQYDSALILLDKAIALDKNLYTTYGNKITIYCNLRDYKHALSESQTQLKIKPDFAEGWQIQGMLYDVLGDSLKAKESYRKSIELYDAKISDPNNVKYKDTYKFNRAISLLLSNKDIEAKKELKELRDQNSDDKSIDEFLNMTKRDLLDTFIKGK